MTDSMKDSFKVQFCLGFFSYGKRCLKSWHNSYKDFGSRGLVVSLDIRMIESFFIYSIMNYRFYQMAELWQFQIIQKISQFSHKSWLCCTKLKLVKTSCLDILTWFTIEWAIRWTKDLIDVTMYVGVVIMHQSPKLHVCPSEYHSTIYYM